MADLVVSLHDPSASARTVSGGKGATLAVLAAGGLPIPDGVVVTTEAYRRVVDDSEIRSLLDELAAAVERDDREARSSIAAKLRRAIDATPLPAGVVDAVVRALPDGPYAVRSSATTEDRPGASFAGQHDTHLDVEPAALDTAIRGCLASLFTDRAVAYRARNAISTTATAMAVVVQRMVDADVSGILVTADPVSGHRAITVIDAGPGLGEAQVSGRSTADAIRYDRRRATVLDYTVGPGRTTPMLTERDVRALAALGDRLEDRLGRPQDVEWAIDDGTIWILQARPLTALFPVPEPPPTDDRLHVYYSFGHRQGMPEAMPPLVLDTWVALTTVVTRRYGFSRAYTATAGGRLYFDLTPFLRHPRVRTGLFRSFEAIDSPAADALHHLLDDRESEFPASMSSIRAARVALGILPGIWDVVGLSVRGLLADLFVTATARTSARVRRAYDADCERALSTMRSPPTVAGRVAAGFDELLGALDWIVAPFYSPFVAGMVAGKLLRRLAPEHGALIDALALGIEDDAVFRMTMELGDLADVARESPDVAAAIREGVSIDALEEMEEAEGFLAAFDGFLDEYGFRAVGEIDLSRPRYREDPTPLLNAIAGSLETSESGEHRRTAARLAGRAHAAERRLVRSVTPLVRPLVSRLASVYRAAIGIREHPKFALARLLAAQRRAVLAAGEALVAAGALSDASAVWFLTRDEIQSGLDDPRMLAGVDVAGRRAGFERVRALEAPHVLTSDGEVPRPPPDPTTGPHIRGTGAAPGVVEGVVHVITDPGRERLDRGEILVAPYTDPGWTPLFLNAAAIVTDVGGRLTHGSLVAREYGIPAVVAADEATTRLHTGDCVRVDGTRGIVELVEPATEAGAAPSRSRPDADERRD